MNDERLREMLAKDRVADRQRRRDQFLMGGKHMIRFLFVLLLFWATSAGAQWVTCTETTWASQSPWQGPTAVFINTYTGVGMSAHPEGTWHTVFLPEVVPWEAKQVFLDGILIITHGTTLPEIADLTIAFRAPGETYDYTYNLQAVEALRDGVRLPVFTPVPVRWRRFEMKWTRSTQGLYPQHSSYGVNLSVVGWCR